MAMPMEDVCRVCGLNSAEVRVTMTDLGLVSEEPLLQDVFSLPNTDFVHLINVFVTLCQTDINNICYLCRCSLDHFCTFGEQMRKVRGQNDQKEYMTPTKKQQSVGSESFHGQNGLSSAILQHAVDPSRAVIRLKSPAQLINNRRDAENILDTLMAQCIYSPHGEYGHGEECSNIADGLSSLCAINENDSFIFPQYEPQRYVPDATVDTLPTTDYDPPLTDAASFLVGHDSSQLPPSCDLPIVGEYPSSVDENVDSASRASSVSELDIKKNEIRLDFGRTDQDLSPIDEEDPSPIDEADPSPIDEEDPSPIDEEDPSPIDKEDSSPIDEEDSNLIDKEDPSLLDINPSFAEDMSYSDEAPSFADQQVSLADENPTLADDISLADVNPSPADDNLSKQQQLGIHSMDRVFLHEDVMDTDLAGDEEASSDGDRLFVHVPMIANEMVIADAMPAVPLEIGKVQDRIDSNVETQKRGKDMNFDSVSSILSGGETEKTTPNVNGDAYYLKTEEYKDEKRTPDNSWQVEGVANVSSGTDVYSCLECDIPCRSTAGVRSHFQLNHLERYHGLDTNYCAVCQKRFRSQPLYMKHLLHHTSGGGRKKTRSQLMACPVCCRLIRGNKGALSTHIKSHTTQTDGRFASPGWGGGRPPKEGFKECHLCDLPFKSARLLTHHLVKVHRIKSRAENTDDLDSPGSIASNKPFDAFVPSVRLANEEIPTSRGGPNENGEEVTTRDRQKTSTDALNKVSRSLEAEFSEDADADDTLVDGAPVAQSPQDSPEPIATAEDTSDRPFACNLCPEFFRTQTELTVHVTDLHLRRNISHFCRACRTPIEKARHSAHLRSHGPKHKLDYVCNHCDETLTKFQVLYAHVYTHTGRKPFRCGICSHEFCHTHISGKHIPQCVRQDDDSDTNQVEVTSAKKESICIDLIPGEISPPKEPSVHKFMRLHCEKCGVGYRGSWGSSPYRRCKDCNGMVTDDQTPNGSEVSEGPKCSPSESNDPGGALSCGLCKRTFRLPRFLANHMRSHRSVSGTKGLRRWTREIREASYRLPLSADIEVTCPWCGEMTHGETEYADHLTGRHGNVVVLCECAMCGGVLPNKLALRRHIQNVHF